jgi:DNA-binding winged helix-turn-helix (wHTH) protein
MDSATDQPPFRSFVFDQWLLQSDGTLMRDGQGINVPPKELHVLRLLLGSAGTVISKDQLLASVWPAIDAAEESLTRCIYALRKLLKENKSFIATVYGHGYRFTCPAAALDSPGEALAAVPSLAVLPFRGASESEALDLQDAMIRKLTAAFGEAVRFVPSGVMAAFDFPVDARLLVEKLAPDYYVSGRFVRQGEQLQWSIELIRGRDHVLVHGQILDGNGLDQSLAELACLIAQRLPGIRPTGNSCSSYPAAVAYLKGVCSVQRHNPQSLRDALVQFRQCLQLANGYSPPWCGLADVWLGKAMLGLCEQEHAINEADYAISQALLLDPCNIAALTRLALLTSLRGCEDAAQALFRRCLLASDQADVHYFVAWHHWFWRRNNQAAESIDKCLRHDPTCVRAQVLRVRITLTGNPQDAALMARQNLQQDASGHSLLVILHAVVLAYVGQHAAAWHELEQAGMSESAVGEQGLAAWNVLFGVNPLIARNQYVNWLSFARSRSLGEMPTSLPSGVMDGSMFSPLWRSLQRQSPMRDARGVSVLPIDHGRRLA